jgi:hypothetical protein
MIRLRLLATFCVGLLLINPAVAQSPAAPQPATAPPEATVPAGSLTRVQNAWPARSLIGATVFNDSGQRLASVRELLVTDDGKVDRVVLTVGRRGRLVAVSFGQLRFVPSQRFDTPVLAVRGRMSRMVDAAHADRRPYGIMLPGETQDSLLKMESIQLAP